MMGQRIEDPHGIEGPLKAVEGLGLLPQYTVITPEKTTLQRTFRFLDGAERGCKGYEIHMGETHLMEGAEPHPLAFWENDSEEGYLLNERCWGTYLHGILDNSEVLDFLESGLNENRADKSHSFSYEMFKEEQYNKLADLVREHIDMDKVYRILSE